MILKNALIIDDEPLVREDLKFLLQEHPEINVIGEAASVDEGAVLLSKTSPDVVFLDIQLRGGSGFDLVAHISPSSAIVFFTAHDEYAVRAFEVNALDYLMKPVSRNRLALALSRLKSSRKAGVSIPSARALDMDDQVFIQTDQEQRFVPVNGISAITYEGGNYSSLEMNSGQKHLVRRNLKQWEEQLPDPFFLRVHRSALVNIQAIESLQIQKSGSCALLVAGRDQLIEVSRRMAPRVKAVLKKR